LQGASALPEPPPANDTPHTGGRIALLALAGALLIISLTLFVVGIALGNRDASADAPPTLAPDFPLSHRAAHCRAADALSRGYADIQKWRMWRQGQANRHAATYYATNAY
jgi:hypothetical protein